MIRDIPDTTCIHLFEVQGFDKEGKRADIDGYCDKRIPEERELQEFVAAHGIIEDRSVFSLIIHMSRK
jgi:hypothetical protein